MRAHHVRLPRKDENAESFRVIAAGNDGGEPEEYEDSMNHG
jgi:hypothetical protein